MHLQTVIVDGFKSFAEAKIDFPQGVTAIVGPNGTGKSNIVDALLWSLGEQSPKSLRTERMEDVIFNGTEVRKPMNMVEVSTVFGGVTEQELEALSALGDALGQSTEIMITRRLYRDGESEYSINKIPCRLKDIRSLLWASRAGSKGHTVIEQGNIDQLLSASPLERREFIEETAGIIRYKKQKAEALRKLDSTEQNLFRVRDILTEVQRQLRSLERQARQAQHYQDLQQEAKALEIQLLKWECRQLRTQQDLIERELQESEDRELAHVTEEQRVMAEQENVTLSLSKTGESVSESREQLREVEQAMAHALTTMEVLRNQLEHYEEQHEHALKERSRVREASDQSHGLTEAKKARLSQIQSEIETLEASVVDGKERYETLIEQRSVSAQGRDRLRQLLVDLAVQKTNIQNRTKSMEEQQGGLLRRLERLLAELTETETQQTRLSAENQEFRQQREVLSDAYEQLQTKQKEMELDLQTLVGEQEELDSRLQTRRTVIAGLESEIRALRAVVQEELGYGPTGEIDESSIRGVCHEVVEAFAERMVVQEHVEKAIEVALGDRLKAWVVGSPDDALQAIRTLKGQSLGRGSFVSLTSGTVASTHPPMWRQALHEETAIKGAAIEFVQVPDALQSVTSIFLENVYIVETLEAGLHIMETHEWFHGRGPILVTPDGEMIQSSGVMTGGMLGEFDGVLRRRGEISRLEAQSEELEGALREDERRRNVIVTERDAIQSQLHELRQSIRETEVRLLSVRQEESVRTNALPELTRRVELIRAERSSEEGEVGRLRRESALLQEQLREVEGTLGQREQELQEASQGLIDLEAEVDELQKYMTETRMSLSTLLAQRSHEQSDLARLRDEEQARAVRLQELDQHLEQLFLQTRQSRDERLRQEEMFEKADEKKTGIEASLTTLQEHYDHVVEQSRMFDRHISDIRKQLSETLKVRSGIEVRMAEVRTKLTTVQETLTATYELSLDALDEEEGGERQPEPGAQPASSEQDEEGILDDPSEQWKEQLQLVRGKLARMGPINLAAIDEHQELQERCQFLTAQEADLTASIQSLQEIIQRLNQTTSKLFTETFQSIQIKFNEVFSALFAGGRAELILVEPEVEEGETARTDAGVDIVAQPPGKRLKNLSMLSGGEKTMTVLALLFASFLIKPSPFCILDEVDAPLDEANVGRFGQFLTQMAERSQFIIITHNKRTMEIADSLFGVTMEQPGVSKLVSVRLNELQKVS
ncbi:MAG: chromosome segregation protein SMC [Nitrospirales bacterium]|nr:chromosome segregation protein SMC [Nitrospira sp.]MDR4501722.1 chromosome segregation protein SMC [Nitrospirales bacterium]